MGPQNAHPQNVSESEVPFSGVASGRKQKGRPETQIPPASRGIYLLLDPLTTEVRYVGQSHASRIGVRYNQHLSYARGGVRTPVADWIRSLLAHDQVPEVLWIDWVPPGEVSLVEQQWIAYYLSLGARLTNRGSAPARIRHHGVSKQCLNVMITQSLITAVKAHMEKSGLTFSEIVCRALQTYLQQ